MNEQELVRFGTEIFPADPLCDIMINEARSSLARIRPVLVSLPDKPSVLEVGAGSCLLAAYLASNGMNVTAADPVGSGFDFFTDLQNKVLARCRSGGIPLTLERTTGEQLDIQDRFDFAFTVNSLEHMQEPLLVLDNIYRSLKPGGVMLVHCPNYTVPFDSHIGIPLVTRSKALNGWLWRSKIAKQPAVWDELNFIRYVDLQRHMDKRGWAYTFSTSTVRDAVARLQSDPIFAERMPRFIHFIATTLNRCGVLGKIPTRLQSPMEALVRKPY